MMRGARRTAVGAVLTAALATGASACSSGPSATSTSTAAPSSAAREVCAAVARAINAGPDQPIALSAQIVAEGEQSGDRGLSAASRRLLQALSQPGDNI